ncbi:glycosyltransferase family 4 protein, partial [Spiribacter roseus]|uniref:glycosyltransferase family 4 protein n=1 Tax=Spiribacter roseus TaxID=1855875 RepID=UPI00132FAE22
KVIHLNHSDISGGAARATYRIHHSLRYAGVDSRMWVNKATAGDWTVEGPATKGRKALAAVRGRAVSPLVKTLKTGNPIIHSPAILPSQWVKRINTSDADIVHLHWVQGEMLSIANIGRIQKPIVWTLHDMWAFCGAEHYTEDHRWRDGYRRDNRPSHESGFDLNRWTWQRKRKHWQRPMHIVTPSQWLADCVRVSTLMSDWPVDVVSYPIDIDRWSSIEKNLARELLGLPQGVPLLLFGAMGGARDPRKGFDLLINALDQLDKQIPGLELVIFGQLEPMSKPDLGFPIHYAGHLHDNISLRVLYSAADVYALPSRQDNLPLTCMESLSCGTPVVAFNTSGPPSMVEHKKTGYLADAFDAKDFARGITHLIDHCADGNFGKSARVYAERCFSPNIIANQYLDIYKKVLA